MQSVANQWDLNNVFPGLVVIDPARSGKSNMAIDEALLQNATPQWPIVLRVYRWERPTLSIGHFQRIEDRQYDPRLCDLPWVKRKTGGGAIVHDSELTYSILVPRRETQPVKGHNEALYRAIHLAFVDNLKTLGWDANLSETCTCKTTSDKETDAFLCFSRRTPVDLLVGGYKILGSAQRRTATGLIQHGSFLFRRAQSAPELFGLLDRPHDGAKEIDRGNHMENACSTDFEPMEMDFWIEFFVASLKLGVSQLLQVNWQNGKLSDVLEIDESGVAGRN